MRAQTLEWSSHLSGDFSQRDHDDGEDEDEDEDSCKESFHNSFKRRVVYFCVALYTSIDYIYNLWYLSYHNHSFIWNLIFLQKCYNTLDNVINATRISIQKL